MVRTPSLPLKVVLSSSPPDLLAGAVIFLSGAGLYTLSPLGIGCVFFLSGAGIAVHVVQPGVPGSPDPVVGNNITSVNLLLVNAYPHELLQVQIHVHGLLPEFGIVPLPKQSIYFPVVSYTAS